MEQILLMDEEVDYQVDYIFKHNRGMPLEVLLKPLIHSSAKAQLLKVAKWGDEPCFHLPSFNRRKRQCSKCWQALLKEAYPPNIIEHNIRA